MQIISTTPFGRRSLSLAMVARAAQARDFAARPDAGAAAVHKWRLFRALTEAKERLGVADRALSVLHALLSFHQETALTLAAQEGAPRPGLVVFPSNRELSIRAHGMAPATLRRHLAALVEAGLILRRDSPNGKRFARRGEGGAIEDAFGFDLTPLVARAEEIETLAAEMRAAQRARALLRERITLLRRDIAKMLETGLAEGLCGDWEDYGRRAAALSLPLSRKAPQGELETLAQELTMLAAELCKLLESHVKDKNPSASESRNERHIQNQTTKFSDIEPRLQKGGPENFETPDSCGAPLSEASAPASASGGARAGALPLGVTLAACPDIADFAPGGAIDSWRDLAAAAAVARGALGVSPDAWRAAVDVLGETDAAVALAAILQRGPAIASAGGYLRALTAKAREGAFSTAPLVIALLRTRPAAGGARPRLQAG